MMRLDELVRQLQLAYGDGLRSVVLFGSAVAGEHHPKKSDYNVLVVVDSLPLDRLRDTYVGSICGIAAPESFEGALKKLGAHVDLAKRYIDHHYYTEAELTTFINRCIRRDLAMIVTTEKDAVRMPRLPEADMKVPICFLRVEIQILSGHESWEHCVARICKPQPMLSPERFFA